MMNRSKLSSAIGWLRTGWMMLCAAATIGCGNVTAGGATGEVDTQMSGNASRGTAPAAAGEPATGPAQATPVSSLTFEGDVTATASVEIVHASGPTASLTPLGAVTVTADLEGTQEPTVSSDVVVSAGQYVTVRIVFTQVTADVTANLEIGGVPFTGIVNVDLSGGTLEVARTVDLFVPEGESVGLLIDLNADGWVPLADVATGVVDAADFAAAVSVTVR